MFCSAHTVLFHEVAGSFHRLTSTWPNDRLSDSSHSRRSSTCKSDHSRGGHVGPWSPLCYPVAGSFHRLPTALRSAAPTLATDRLLRAGSGSLCFFGEQLAGGAVQVRPQPVWAGLTVGLYWNNLRQLPLRGKWERPSFEE